MATLLLLKDVYNLGRKGDIVTTKEGYARNFLVPKRHAVPADKNAVRMQERLKEERLKQAAEDKKDSEALAAKLAGITLETTVKVDPEGHMYGSVTIVDVLEMLQEGHEIALERHNVALKQPIKKTGVHAINFKLKEGVDASLSLKVIPEGGVELKVEEPQAEEASAEAAAEEKSAEESAE